ncbi:MAG: hypothetical protein WEC75_08290 [Dehalococcoidia bacterium]
MTRLIASLATGALGVALTLAGLGWDAWLHAEDPTLAGRESIFSLTNPGHALLAAGMALTCGGILAAAHAAWGMARPRGLLGRSLVRHGSLAAGAVASMGAVVFALAVSTAGHAHGDEAHTRTHAEAVVAAGMASGPHPQALPVAPDAAALPPTHAEAPAATTDDLTDMHADVASSSGATHGAHADDTAPMDGSSGEMAAVGTHAHPVPGPVTAEEIACGRDLLDRARAAAEKYSDEAAALAGGYVQNKDAGTHYRNNAYARDAAVLDVEHPETLVYWTAPDGRKVLIGVMFHALRGQPGPTPCGPVSTWHTHTACVDLATKTQIDAMSGACPDGAVARESGQMMHIWFVNRKSNSFAEGISPTALDHAEAQLTAAQ